MVNLGNLEIEYEYKTPYKIARIFGRSPKFWRDLIKSGNLKGCSTGKIRKSYFTNIYFVKLYIKSNLNYLKKND